MNASDLSPLQKVIRVPLRFIPQGMRIRVKRGINRGALWIVGSGDHGCWIGTYESEKQSLLRTRVKPGMVLWDVGANVGFYTLAFSRLTGSKGRVYSFEPFYGNISFLHQHLALNSAGNVAIVQAAMAGNSSFASFAIGASSASGKLSGDVTGYWVPTTSGDEFLARFPEARPHLIKIDIEGAEGEFLAGSRKLLASAKPELWIALHGQKAKDDCWRVLRECGYRAHYFDGSAAEQGISNGDEIYAVKVQGQ